MKIETTVSVKMTDARGQVSEHARTIVTQAQDNPRFWSRTASMEIDAASATVVGAVEHEFGPIVA